MTSRRSTAELESEFERLVAQIEAFDILIPPDIAPEIRPGRVARQFKQKLGLSVAIEGCKQALNDCLEIASEASREQQALIDAQLVQAGMPRLHMLMARQSRAVGHILKQGALRTETEFYLLKNVVDDLESRLSDKQRALAESMLARFERESGGAV